LGGKTAAEYGAVGALVRSATPYSINSVHTGSQMASPIPTAAIAIEDAEMFQRMQDRGQKITLELTL
jgi:carboxypeptidase Q